MHTTRLHLKLGLTTRREVTRQKSVSADAKALTATPIVSQAKHRMAMISRANPAAVRVMHNWLHLSRSWRGGNKELKRQTWTTRVSFFTTELSRR
jgi:hypothetical protein